MIGDKDKNYNAFSKEVAKYFMEFLETNFQRRRVPKRSIKSKNSKNLLIGTNLKKYFNFYLDLLEQFHSNKKLKNITVPKGKYTIKPSKAIESAISHFIENLNADNISVFNGSLSEELIINAKKYHDDVELGFIEATKIVRIKIYHEYVEPIFDQVGESLKAKYSLDDDAIAVHQSELAEAISQDFLDELQSAYVQNTQNPEALNQVIFDLLGKDHLVEVISHFFDSLAIDDLFNELNQLLQNKSILDKVQLYLYFCDVTFEKHTFPIFYIPIKVRRNSALINVEFDTSIYINKKAVEYVNQKMNALTNRTGSIDEVNERIIYLSDNEDSLHNILQPILSAITSKFQTDSEIELKSSVRQISKNQFTKISNTAYFSLFDSSDEALINDYEEILNSLDSNDSEESSLFDSLLSKFIDEEPIKINSEVRDDWDNLKINDKLVYASPIPVNAEQRQILTALKRNDISFLSVEGPPGTGKSHTIVAIAFDAILSGKSILILSDKKEALDVVEDKIIETLNSVRLDEDFQNPILRLGKTGSTYGKILNTTALNKIRSHYRAFSDYMSEFDDKTNNLFEGLKSRIGEYVEGLSSVDSKKVARLHTLESKLDNTLTEAFDFGEIQDDPDKFLAELKRLYEVLFGLFILQSEEKRSPAYLLRAFFKEIDFRLVEQIAQIVQLVDKIELTSGEAHALSESVVLSKERRQSLSHIVRRFADLKMPIFGYFFRKNELKSLAREVRGEIIASSSEDYYLLKSACDLNSAVDKIEKSLNLTEPSISTTVAQMYLIDKERFSPLWSELYNELDFCEGFIEEYPNTAKALGLISENIDSYHSSILISIDEESLLQLCEYIGVRSEVLQTYENLPKINLEQEKNELRQLYTANMTFRLDKNIIDFHENNSATAKDLKSIISGKKRFPREKFEKLREAFPCIIAGIRDYAEFIPLEKECFDIVIIDEASQVSIAQALPALLRAKKILVLGDKKQFSNVKSNQARSETNRQYLNTLEAAFKKNISSEAAKMERLKKFNIKTSILDFFDYISHFNIMLRKHFRGYKELISYSSKTFYNNELQAIKIRSKPVSDILEISVLEHDEKAEPIENTNQVEIAFILNELDKIYRSSSSVSIGVITPHTNQQQLLQASFLKRDFAEEMLKRNKVKFMTFDTCQGEERDIIFYSMVATRNNDKLRYVFASNLDEIDFEEDGKIKAQRLNVGFSRAKEKIHFVLSKPIDEFTGEIQKALRHFQKIQQDAPRVASISDVDQSSPMEKKALQWILNSDFYNRNQERVEVIAQFEIGEYLKQLDPFYSHPSYKADFLLTYKDDEGEVFNIIIEYDGFKEHFENLSEVNRFNFEMHQSEKDIFRQKVIESYGYIFIRLNRFVIGSDPIDFIDKSIKEIISSGKRDKSKTVIDYVKGLAGKIANGQLKECPKCKELRELSEFKDSSLKSGISRNCRSCKMMASRKVKAKRNDRPKLKTKKSLACPNCGARMVLRRGKFGEFHGCSKYPSCRGTRAA